MNVFHYMLGLRLWEGGVVRAVIDLCNALARRGHSVDTFTTDASDAPADWPVEPARLAGRPTLHVLAAGRRMGMDQLGPSAMAEVRTSLAAADVVHLDVPWDPICAQIADAAYAMGKPYVFGVHGMLDDWTMRSGAFHKRIKKAVYLRVLGRRVLERAYRVLLASEAERAQSERHYPRGKSAVIPLLFDLSAFEHLPGPEQAQKTFGLTAEGGPVVLSLGRLDRLKQNDLLIRAVALMRERGVMVQLVIAGSGPEAVGESLRGLAEELGVGKQVKFTGYVEGALKLSLYQSAAVFASASAHESFGMSIIEALASGLPVVISRAVNIWQELERGSGAGVSPTLIADLSPEAYANALGELVQDGERRKAMSAAAIPFVRGWLNADRVVGLYEALYRDASALGRAVAAGQ